MKTNILNETYYANTELPTRELISEVEVRDPLTGVLSKDAFYAQARKLIDSNPDVEFAFITSDIESFRTINDLYGYEAGDELLKHCASKIQRVCRKFGGICGRYFADIFISVVPLAENLIEKIVKETRRATQEGPISPAPNVKFGIYIIEDRSLPLPAMCDRSMMALATIRGQSRVKYVIYEERFREKLLKEQFVSEHIDAAIKNGEIHIYLQPKYSLESRTINGGEALVRWISPINGFIQPADFIPILEAKGIALKVDLYVWEEICKLLRRWIDTGIPLVPISVNVSQSDIDNPLFEKMLISLVERYCIPTKYFILEITETTYTNLMHRLLQAIKNLRAYGFRVEMDDFGSGSSSLSKLKDFPVDDIKIDLDFLAGSKEHTRGRRIVKLVVDLAKDLELGVIAEGVETAEQAEFLESIGCQTAQGYYFAKPMPISDFERLVQEELEHNKS